MESTPLAIALTALVLTAGCLGAGTDEPSNGSDAPAAPDGPDVEPTADDSSTSDADADPAAEDGLDRAPDWKPGEWWRVRLYSSLLDEDFEVTRIVTGTEGEDYLVGMPRDAWDERALVLHVPGFGEVRGSDLSFEAHDVRFVPLDFPLTAGKSWQTDFEGLPVDATVEAVDGDTAELSYCCGRSINATYDAGMRTITSLDVDDGFIGYEVVDHGYNYTGVVTVPHGHDLVFNHGRVASVVDLRTFQPAPPVETMELSDDYGRVSFVQIVGPLGLVERPVSSAYIERATGPDGTTFETRHMPADGSSFSVAFHETTELGGEWSFEHIAPGPGIAFTEGIAYHVFDIELPGGTLLGDHSEHMTP